MERSTRPLSPHLQVYRPQLTSLLSICHRATGVFLTIGTPLLVFWLLSLAAGPAAYARAQSFFGSWFGQLILLGWSFALFYHLCNGIRHLFWDVGKGFELKTLYASGYAVIIASVLLTLLAWVVGYAVHGGAG